jgi:hypothetical protein
MLLEISFYERLSIYSYKSITYRIQDDVSSFDFEIIFSTFPEFISKTGIATRLGFKEIHSIISRLETANEKYEVLCQIK